VEGIIGDRILRCSDGHYFTAGESARLVRSIHFGPKRLVRCPVDGKWRLAGNARSTDLTPEHLQQAQRYRA
jgi:hypothetical protein